MSLQVELLFGALFLINVVFFIDWIRSRKRYVGRRRPLIIEYPVGLVFAFFDTLGIGSFAPTTAALKFQGKIPDEQIPGTLNIGLNTAAMLEMVIMVSGIVIDPVLLMSTVLSAALGAWIGAGVVNRMPRPAIQLAMGAALLIAGCVFAATNLHLLPGGGVAMDLTGWRFALAVAVNFVLGALMSVGIGLYAPCMIVVTLLGLHPIAAFPIMMGACGLVQPTAGLQFFRSGRYGFGTSIALTIGSIPGVLLAAFVVKRLPLEALRWLVVVVVVYAASTMLRSFWTSRVELRAAPPLNATQ
ncbi:MAG TPA: sulfite exporter TauE/SafE family protein [Steroidobacteraceae bacterium]|nr:sulfite exporter TauE/SafE family protein [Steroidobacteraceae bacterium]